MGSVYAAFFAQAGNEVWVLDVDDAHIRAIARNGLRIEGFSGNRVVHGINAVTTPERVGPSDLVVIATKAADVGAAASIVAPLLRRDTTVLTIQNGLGAGERIARYLPSDRILIGVAEAFGASVRGPGVVHHNSMKMIRLGEFTGGDSDRLRKVASMWQA
ncbi:MAG: 2-dehydropantoate 2-reductase, partial [Proteobacteria bacterium]